MMIPLQDDNPTRTFTFLTYGLIVVNVLVFLWELTFTPEQLHEMFLDYSIVPAQAGWNAETTLDVFRSMFFHGGWAHLGGNMLYLYLFGNNVEDRLGKVVFLLVYFVSGIGAALAQIMIDPASAIPLVGASGAIAGVLGGYLVLFPKVKVRGLVPMGRTSMMTELPAVVVLLMWFGLQLLNGVASLGAANQAGGGVAFFAHIGGFVVGMILAGIFALLIPAKHA